eukprot:scaffold75269_cov57-Phaeocystis_antarctica.AAC.1
MHHEWLRTESLDQRKRPHRGSCTLSMNQEWVPGAASGAASGAGRPPSRRPKAGLAAQDEDADAMGGDDDDGFGAVQMGAPKVKPRAGPGRATMQADDDDEMGGGGDDDLDFARGLSALERAKAARLQAEREP